MKIAFSGAHSTGKSTSLGALKGELEKRGYRVGTVSDLAVKCPLPILRQHTAESSLWIAVQGVADEIAAQSSADIVLVDRPVVDAWGYLGCASMEPNPNSSALKMLETLVRQWMPTYDIVFGSVLDESIPIEANKGRILDPIYRREVAHAIASAQALFDVKVIDLTSHDKESWLSVAVAVVESQSTLNQELSDAVLI